MRFSGLWRRAEGWRVGKEVRSRQLIGDDLQTLVVRPHNPAQTGKGVEGFVELVGLLDRPLKAFKHRQGQGTVDPFADFRWKAAHGSNQVQTLGTKFTADLEGRLRQQRRHQAAHEFAPPRGGQFATHRQRMIGQGVAEAIQASTKERGVTRRRSATKRQAENRSVHQAGAHLAATACNALVPQAQGLRRPARAQTLEREFIDRIVRPKPKKAVKPAPFGILNGSGSGLDRGQAAIDGGPPGLVMNKDRDLTDRGPDPQFGDPLSNVSAGGASE